MEKSGPQHVAIIMDGNGRWARKNNLPTIEGHRKGAEAAKIILQESLAQGVRYLTLYAFSSENWNRPTAWVDDLMNLLRLYLIDEAEDILTNKMRLRVIGERTRLPPDIQDLITTLEEKTAHNTDLCLQIALSYGARDEIVHSCKQIAADCLAGKITLDEITSDTLSQHLYTATIPDPDFLIRTSGEHRISNFLLWQLAYSEFIFTPKLWPDFTAEDFQEALTLFAQRDRRYGASFGEVA